MGDKMAEVSKTQMIRLADVFFIGPVMIYGGKRLRKLGNPALGITLMVLGGLTIWYNGKNYLANARQLGDGR